MSESKPLKSKSSLTKLAEAFGRKRKAPAPAGVPVIGEPSEAPAAGLSTPVKPVETQPPTLEELGRVGTVQAGKSVSFDTTQGEAGAAPPTDEDVSVVTPLMINQFILTN